MDAKYVLFLVVLGLFDLLEGKSGELCFEKDDTKDLNTFMDLVDTLVKEKCGRNYSEYCRNFRPIDCYDIKQNNRDSASGEYTIWPVNRNINGSIQVWCDMDDDGGGWTVIQRRGQFNNPESYFYRKWSDYKAGFGNLDKEFWLGNDNIHGITNQRIYALKVTIKDAWNYTRFASYSNFRLENEDRLYTLHVIGYKGNAGDSLSYYHNSFPFSTYDKENQKHKCATTYKGAWWYVDSSSCYWSNLNGMNYGTKTTTPHGIIWYTYRNTYYSMIDVDMKIRPFMPQ